MTSERVKEIMARARCERHYMERFNQPADSPVVIANMANWEDFAGEVELDLKALKAAGYAIVPVEPTEAMIEAMDNASWEIAVQDFIPAGGQYVAMYRAAIKAAGE